MNQMFESIPLGREKCVQRSTEIGKIFENFEDAQNRLKPTLDVYIAHTEHPLTHLKHVWRLLTDLKFRPRDQILENFEGAQNRLKPTLDVCIAHTDHLLTYLHRI